MLRSLGFAFFLSLAACAGNDVSGLEEAIEDDKEETPRDAGRRVDAGRDAGRDASTTPPTPTPTPTPTRDASTPTPTLRSDGGAAPNPFAPGDRTPSPDNIPECPKEAPENPVGSCIGVPIYATCSYTTYNCICDWYHWICI